MRAFFGTHGAQPLCQRRGAHTRTHAYTHWHTHTGSHGAWWRQSAAGGRTDEPRIRISGGTACRNPVVKSARSTRQKCAEGGWVEGGKSVRSSVLNQRLPHGTEDTRRAREREGAKKRKKKNPTGDEYQRCQGVSRTPGDTSTIWGERCCALYQVGWGVKWPDLTACVRLHRCLCCRMHVRTGTRWFYDMKYISLMWLRSQWHAPLNKSSFLRRVETWERHHFLTKWFLNWWFFFNMVIFNHN